MSKWSDANCMGYAFGINQWLKPKICNRDSDNDFSPYSLSHTIPELISRFHLKQVKKEDMVLGKEYIAYRRSRNDFHFMKRNKYGQWRHKPGSCAVQPISEAKVFASKWYGNSPYQGVIILFEVL